MKFLIHAVKLLALVGLAAGLTGCNRAERLFEKMDEDRQGQFESLAAYQQRQSTLEISVPLTDDSHDKDETDLHVQWAAYDANAGMLNVSIPVEDGFRVGEKYRNPENYGGGSFYSGFYLKDQRLKGQPLTAAIPLPAGPGTEKLLSKMTWVVRFVPEVVREKRVQFTAPVRMVSVELRGPEGVVWANQFPSVALDVVAK